MCMKRVPVSICLWCGLLAVGAISLQGCATNLDQRYIPQTVGYVDPSLPVDGLTIEISPKDDRVILGRPITFEASIRNTGQRAFWVPRDPNLIFIWVYPNGQRDNFVQEQPLSRHFDRRNAILLKPGEEMHEEFTIRTHYFPKTGITEFRAIFQAAENTNPRLQPFWNGKVFSNAYGILVDKPRYGSWSSSLDRRCLAESKGVTI